MKKMGLGKVFLFLVLALVIAFPLAAGCGKTSTTTVTQATTSTVTSTQTSTTTSVIKPGEPIVIADLPAVASSYGPVNLNGANLAVDEINAAGGIIVGGISHQLKFVYQDSNEFKSVPDAITAAQDIVTREKPYMLMGIISSQAAPSVLDICADNKVLFFSVGTGSPQLPAMVKKDYNRYKYWFRVSPVNSGYIGQLIPPYLNYVAGIMREKLGLAADAKLKVAILSEKGEAADIITKAPQDALASLNLEQVGVWRPDAAATDLTAELTAIKLSGAQLATGVFISALGVTAAKQWGQLQIPVQWAGINGSAQAASFWDATAGAASYIGCDAMTPWGRVAHTPKTIAFWDNYVAKYKQEPGSLATTYDAVYLLKDAIEKAGTLDKDKVISTLEANTWTGACWYYKFQGINDAYPHDLTMGPQYASYMGSQWINGKHLIVWPYNYQGITYEGTAKFEIAPWVLDYWKGKVGK